MAVCTRVRFRHRPLHACGPRSLANADVPSPRSHDLDYACFGPHNLFVGFEHQRPRSRPVGACDLLYVSTFSCLGSFCSKRCGRRTVFVAHRLGCGGYCGEILLRARLGCSVSSLGAALFAKFSAVLLFPVLALWLLVMLCAALEGIDRGSAPESWPGHFVAGYYWLALWSTSPTN